MIRREIALSIVVVAAALGLVVGWLAADFRKDHAVREVRGFTSAVNFDGTAIGLVLSRDAQEGEGFNVAGALWRSMDRPGWGRGPAPGGAPTCLEPLTSGQEVRLGVVKARPGSDTPGTDVVVWLECLSKPTDRFG